MIINLLDKYPRLIKNQNNRVIKNQNKKEKQILLHNNLPAKGLGANAISSQIEGDCVRGGSIGLHDPGTLLMFSSKHHSNVVHGVVIDQVKLPRHNRYYSGHSSIRLSVACIIDMHHKVKVLPLWSRAREHFIVRQVDHISPAQGSVHGFFHIKTPCSLEDKRQSQIISGQPDDGFELI